MKYIAAVLILALAFAFGRAGAEESNKAGKYDSLIVQNIETKCMDLEELSSLMVIAIGQLPAAVMLTSDKNKRFVVYIGNMSSWTLVFEDAKKKIGCIVDAGRGFGLTKNMKPLKAVPEKDS